MSSFLTYACTKTTPIYQDHRLDAPIAENGTARLDLGQIFVGRPEANNFVWISTGVGFVPGDAVKPAFIYRVAAETPVYEDRRAGAPIALGGTARLHAGDTITGALIDPGWVWMTNGTGFVPAGFLIVEGQPTPTYGGGGQVTPPPPPPEQPGGGIYEVKGSDTLWDIAEKFYDDGTRWPEIYAVPQNQATIGPDPRQVRPGQRLIIPGTTSGSHPELE